MSRADHPAGRLGSAVARAADAPCLAPRRSPQSTLAGWEVTTLQASDATVRPSTRTGIE